MIASWNVSYLTVALVADNQRIANGFGAQARGVLIEGFAGCAAKALLPRRITEMACGRFEFEQREQWPITLENQPVDDILAENIGASENALLLLRVLDSLSS